VPKKPPHPALKALGHRIRVERTRCALSQEALADKAGLDRSFMSGIERGVRSTSVINILKIADALGVTPGLLLDRLPPLVLFCL